jgi:hypothetical protein
MGIGGDKGMEKLPSENIPSENDSLTELIIKCIIEVHRTLGPGFLESIYNKSLLIELQKNSLKSEAEKEIRVSY